MRSSVPYVKSTRTKCALDVAQGLWESGARKGTYGDVTTRTSRSEIAKEKWHEGIRKRNMTQHAGAL